MLVTHNIAKKNSKDYPQKENGLLGFTLFNHSKTKNTPKGCIGVFRLELE